MAANWPDARPETTQAVLHALDLAEQSAAEGKPAAGLHEAVVCAVATAGTALMGLYGSPFEGGADAEPLPKNGNAAKVASFVAKVAEYAARAAESSRENALEPVLEAYGFARSTGNEQVLESLRLDIAELTKLADCGKWTDETPVSPMLWKFVDGSR